MMSMGGGGRALPFREVKSARKEEIGFLESRNIWSFAPISESLENWERLPSVLDGLMSTKEEMSVWKFDVVWWPETFKGEIKIGTIYLRRHHLWKLKE